MNDKFITLVRTNIDQQLEKLYLPKVKKGHIHRIILFHCLNASAETDLVIHQISISAKKIDDSETVKLTVNEDIFLEFSIPMPGKEVAHV